MAVTAESVAEVCRRAKAAALILPGVPTAAKDEALTVLARLLRERTGDILAANLVDLQRGREAGLDEALIDRLSLDEERIEAMAFGVEAVIALADPVGELIEERTLASGLEMEQGRVPIGVIAVVYEARPNVTVDAAALCLKSGNAVGPARIELRRRARTPSWPSWSARRSPRRGFPRGPSKPSPAAGTRSSASWRARSDSST